MERTTVKSSMIASIGYDNETSILEVEFVNGKVYQYLSVPNVMYTNLMNSDSAGRYFAREIKHKYNYQEV